MAPVSFLLLNPIAFIFMEFSRRKGEGKGFNCNIIGSVLKQIFSTPLVIMTILGVVFRLLLWQPASDLEWYSDYIEPVFDVISQAFTGMALFSLGLLIVGKFVLLKKNSAVKPTLFILVKSLVLPILIKLFIDFLAPDNPSLSTAGFLYGIFPTQPGVFTCVRQQPKLDAFTCFFLRDAVPEFGVLDHRRAGCTVARRRVYSSCVGCFVSVEFHRR